MALEPWSNSQKRRKMEEVYSRSSELARAIENALAPTPERSILLADLERFTAKTISMIDAHDRWDEDVTPVAKRVYRHDGDK